MKDDQITITIDASKEYRTATARDFDPDLLAAELRTVADALSMRKMGLYAYEEQTTVSVDAMTLRRISFTYIPLIEKEVT